MKDFEPPLVEKFAIVLTSLMISKMEAEQGRVTPPFVLDTLCATVVNLAASTGVDIQELKRESERIINDPAGAMRRAQARMRGTVNEFPC